MSDPVRVIDFPDEWGTANPIDHIAGDPIGMGPNDGFHVFGCLLEDGSNLYALIYPGGDRFVRTAMYTAWGIEERYGPAPKPKDAKRVHELWKEIIDRMIKAGHEVDDQLGHRGLPPARKWPTS